MLKTVYLIEKKRIEKESKNKLDVLAYTYAFSNSDVEIDDVLSDNSGTTHIRVDRIRWGYQHLSNTPVCIYHGPKLTQKLIPYKSGERDDIYQPQLKTNHGRK